MRKIKKSLIFPSPGHGCAEIDRELREESGIGFGLNCRVFKNKCPFVTIMTRYFSNMPMFIAKLT